MGTLAALLNTAKDSRIPLSVMLEINQACNLSCAHCYLPKSGAAHQKLDLSEHTSILEQLAQAGSLFLTITGGEPLLDARFFDLLCVAREFGFAVRLFTNGTLID